MATPKNNDERDLSIRTNSLRDLASPECADSYGFPGDKYLRSSEWKLERDANRRFI